MPKRYDGEFRQHDYDGALAFIQGGKSKRTRKVSNNTYLAIIDTDGYDAIGLVYHQTTIVAYHRDGTVTIDTGGWHTPTTKARIHDFSPARVGNHKGVLSIYHDDDERTPARERKCSKGDCKGTGQVKNMCYVRHDYYMSVPGKPPERVACKHGQTTSHVDGTRECWNCSGTGKIKVGNNPIPTAWSGRAIRLDATGKIIDDEKTYGLPTPAYVGFHTKSKGSPWFAEQPLGITSTLGSMKGDYHVNPMDAPKPYESDGSGVLDFLRTIVPDMAVMVADPTNGNDARQSVESMVMYLNDTHRWTREQIADWLDTLGLDLRLTSAFAAPRGRHPFGPTQYLPYCYGKAFAIEFFLSARQLPEEAHDMLNPTDLIPAADVKPGLTGTDLDDHVKATLRGIEGDVLTSVTLGDVIRLGSQFTAQHRNGFVEGNNHCALAAGALAAKALGFGK